MNVRILIFLCVAMPLLAQVQLSQEQLVIPTYAVSEPESNPIFYTPDSYQNAQLHVYPYPLINTLSDEIIDKSYAALVLENEYIRTVVLPELGGRLYRAVDKTNGYDFYYHNSVIKPALIGMTGAWLSGGIEWNIPHHHRASSFMPVDYRIVENADGSKTAWVGEYEKRHGTRWLVGLTLFPGKAYLQADLRLFNTTPLEQSSLMWANAAVHANENYQVIFPEDVNLVTYHRKVDFADWPWFDGVYTGIDFTKGYDLSWWKNTISPTSFFVTKSDYDFFGGIDHGRRTGLVQYADRHTVNGKKMWNWGNNKVQRLWDQMLTDEDGPYIELMMGAYTDNQPDYTWNAPGQTRRAIMIFYPIKNMSSIKNADENFALNLELQGDRLLIQANATALHKDAQVRVHDADQLLWSERIEIGPDKPFSINVDLKQPVERTKLNLTITADGESLSYSPKQIEKAEHPQPYRRPGDPKSYDSIEELVNAGVRLEQFGNPYFRPEPYYEEVLRRDPGHAVANMQMGLIYLRKNRFKEAEPFLRRSVERATANYTTPKLSDPLYWLGYCLSNLNEEKEAVDLLNRAAWRQGWTAPSCFLLAQIESRRGRFDRALGYLDRALAANADFLDARILQTALLRHLGQMEQARTSAGKALALDPLNFNALYETAILQQGESGQRAALQRAMRDEIDNYLETASRYGNAGFYEEAAAVLNMAVSSPTLSHHPLIYYHLGYWAQWGGQERIAEAHFQKAVSLPTKNVFPHGLVSARALQAAADKMPENAHTHYLLGALWCDDVPERARDEWQKAIQLDPGDARSFRNLAWVKANIFDEVEEATTLMEKAIKLQNDDPLYFAELDEYRDYLGEDVDKRFAMLDEHLETIRQSDRSFVRWLDLLLARGDYDRVIAEMNNRHFRVAEAMERNVHQFWALAYVMRGRDKLTAGNALQALEDFKKALAFPRHLETVHDSKAALAHYFLGLAHQKLDDKEAAQQEFRNMLDYAGGHGWGEGDAPELLYYRSLAAEQLGLPSSANQFLSALRRRSVEHGNTPHSAWDDRSVAQRMRAKEAQAAADVCGALYWYARGNPGKATGLFDHAKQYRAGYAGALAHLLDL